MKKKIPVQPYWAACVIGHNPELGKMVGSFLSFWAQNRYKALEAVRSQLPDNPQWLDSKGRLIHFTILELRQINPDESEAWMYHFTEFFSTVVAGEKPVTLEVKPTFYH